MPHSAIEIQISARVEAPRNKRRITEAVIKQAVIRRSQNPDAEIPGIDLQIIRWRHGSEKWKNAQNTREEWERFGRFLHAASIIVRKIEQVRSR
jgi:hypothetical protein